MKAYAGLMLCALGLGACGARAAAPCATEDCGSDAPPASDAASADAPPVDAVPLKGFGEPCLDRGECASNLCIQAGPAGQCTKLCGDCPDGYGCLGVTGIDFDAQVTFVCVPTSNQLCSPCTQHSECASIGMDRCVTYPDGDQYCSRDCSTVACPTGYACETVDVGGSLYEQCIPTSAACDCTAANPGAIQPCTIMTPWTVCAGTQTCGGAAGWETCAPPSPTDAPDAAYTDDNCDGIDGDLSQGIFVAGGGANTATCGLTYMTPCASISYGIGRAAATSRTEVFVQTGTYDEVVVLANGIHVWGGYDFNWQRGPWSDPAHRVTIRGGQDSGAGGDGEYLAVRAHGLTVPASLADLVIEAPDAVGTVAGNGRSSYGVHVAGSTVQLERVQIVGGDGAPGASGADGLDAVIVTRQSYMDGGAGGDGAEYSASCDSSGRGAGGPRGVNTCTETPSTRDMDGGAGGAGGTMDTSCSVFSPDFDAQPGANGVSADFASGTFGVFGYGSTQIDGACAPSTDPHGKPGAVVNGGGGQSVPGGFTTSGYWYARAGTAGATGQNGGGGGGGGGSAGCDDGTDAYGGGGGGGGAGGCAARSGGGGGGGGGGSFGVFVASGTATLTGCTIQRGIAGSGGQGGRGGRGQDPGLGAGPGQHPGSATPGSGGAGGHGGHGGGGGGGQGGRSVGIGWLPGASVTQDCTITGGAGGAAGPGGVHAPAAPVRDGSDGQAGSAGSVEATRACASASAC